MYSIHPDKIPDGIDYQWITVSVCGDKSFSKVAEFEATGWRMVPLERHPDYIEKSASPKWIECGGLVLVERPKYLTERAQSWEREKAVQQLRNLRPTYVKRKTSVKEFFVFHFWRLRVWWRNHFVKDITQMKGNHNG